MDALILSCGTGGGHNSAGIAVKEELEGRGHHVTMLDPYSIINKKLSSGIGNVYIRLVQKSPVLFGIVYLLGEGYRRLPFRSPVYWIQKYASDSWQDYLAKQHFDVVVMPHLYPAEIFTYLKQHGTKVPLTIFIATDYECIPFTEETDCDYYAVPQKDLTKGFTGRGIKGEKLFPFGIPVRKAFTETISKSEAKKRLGLEESTDYYLLSGGSIGAGDLKKAADIIYQYVCGKENAELIVVCGNNEKLYQRMKKRYPNRVSVWRKTEQMAECMKACEVLIAKPGGLTSTEAAVAGIPLIHISPIPGCEIVNRNYFVKHGMSIGVNHLEKSLPLALKRLENPGVREKMRKNQQHFINANARKDICDKIEEWVRQ